MEAEKTLDISEFLERKHTGYRTRIFWICALILSIDGLDLALIGNILPGLARSFGVSPGAMAIIFVLQGVGLTIGCYGVPLLSDRIGRRRVILVCAVGLAIFTLLCMLARTVTELALLRLLTGIFIGSIHPTLVALVSEYAPKDALEQRVVHLNMIYGLGSATAGLLAPPLLVHFGWQSAFLIIGLAPLLILPLLIWQLPESLRFLAIKGRPAAEIAAIVRRIDPAARVDGSTRFLLRAEVGTKAKVAGLALFRDGRAPVTILLWLAAMMSLGMLTTLTSWLPSFFHLFGGLDVTTAGRMLALSSVGTFVGALLLGGIVRRYASSAAVATTFLLGGATMLLIAFLAADPWLGWMISLGFGAFCVTGHIGLTAIAANIYPTSMRATGVGWMIGAGRISAIFVPAFGGYMLTEQWPLQSIALAFTAPYVAAAVLILVIGGVAARLRARQPETAAPAFAG